MVVTRRTSVPMPPASRTSSTTATPKINKGKMAHSPLVVHDVEETLLNGAASMEGNHSGPQFSDDALFSDGSPPRKIARDRTKAKTKRRESKVSLRRKKRPSSWLDLFSRMFILAFLIYSLSVCPTADKQKSPVCHALSEYRRLVLEPYVITPVQNLLHHPSVSPYTAPVIEKAQPILIRSKQEWNSRVVPKWKTYVVPQWEKRIVPTWNAHVSPQLAQFGTKVGPYVQRASDFYENHATPYLKQAQSAAYKARPYVLLAGAKTYDAYQVSKPYLARLYKELERVRPLVVEYVINPLASARRQYADPHVELLLEKIRELSSGARSSSGDDGSPIFSSTASRQVDGAGKSIEVELPVASEPIAGSETLSSAASIVSASLSLATGSSEPSPNVVSSRSPEASESVTLASASSIISASLILGDEATESIPGATYTPAPGPDLLLGQKAQSDSESKVNLRSDKVVENPRASDTETSSESAAESSSVLEVSVDESTSSGSNKVPKADKSSVSPTDSSKDDELDDLLAELGLDLEETISSDALSPEPSVVEESEEEKAAREAKRLAEVAAKRRELEGRHTRWEEKLADTIEAQKVVLKEALAAIRRTGAAELKINLSIRAGIETLNSEAEKALRGTDAYFTKLRTGGKPVAEQARLWDRVLEKVQAKFDERVQDVEELVNKWYEEEVLSKEREEIDKASNAVRTVAEDAQADIGLDYAWLDDVTYMDWKRYHALIDKHGEFLHEQLALANGSHTDPYPNPVYDAFEDLRSEVQDITLGFETRIRRIKREGERAFAEERAEPERSASEPEVSILPVTDGGKKEDTAFQEVADAILGRSEEEVAAALGRAEEQQPQAVAHGEL
ncbi:hypothetical protein ACEPAH_3672 [Sanghuangporus vaninii]